MSSSAATMAAGGVLLAVVSIAGCSQGPGGGDAPDAGDGGASSEASASWPCADGWMPHATGGCAPAVLECVADGGAAGGASACERVRDRDANAGADGSAAQRPLHLVADRIVGGWAEPGSADEPPGRDWLPPIGAPPRVDDWSALRPGPACPANWTRRPDHVCEPAIRTDCPPGAGPLPDGACTSTSMRDCPADDWPDVSAEIGTSIAVWIRAGADGAMADGSRARPYPTIADARRAQPDATGLLLAAGAYDETVDTTGVLHVVGVCAARVTLLSNSSRNLLSVHGASAALDVRGMTLRSGAHALEALDGATLDVRRVTIARAVQAGLRASDPGTRVRIGDSYIEGIEYDPARALGSGADVRTGASIVARQLSIGRCADTAILLRNPGTTGDLEDVVAHAAAGAPVGEANAGLWMQESARATARRMVIEDGRYGGVAAIHGAQLDATDLVVRRIGPAESNSQPDLLAALTGATVTIARAYFDGTGGAGIVAGDKTTTLRLTDIVAERTTGVTPTPVRAAVDVSNGARLVLSNAAVRNGRGVGLRFRGAGDSTIDRVAIDGLAAPTDEVGARGIFASASSIRATGLLISRVVGLGIWLDTGATLDARESVIRGIRALPDGNFGQAVALFGPATATLAAVRIDSFDSAGVLARGVGAAAALTDCVISAEGASARGIGRGVSAEDGSELTFVHSRTAAVREFGVIALGAGTRARIDRSEIDDTAQTEGGTFGRGVQVQDGAQVDLRASAVRRSHELGVSATGAGTRVVMDGVLVEATASARDGSSGIGFGVQAGAVAQVSHSVVRDSRQFGIVASFPGATIDLADTVILDVAPSALGFGAGLLMFSGATVRVHRVAIANVGGIGVGVLGSVAAAMFEPSFFVGEDLFVHRVRSSTVQVAPASGRLAPSGPYVAYGVHVSGDSSSTISRVVCDAGGYGFALELGRLSITQGVFARQLDGRGAILAGGSRRSLTTVSVVGFGNPHDDVVDDATLPAATSLPLPTSVCVTPPCP